SACYAALGLPHGGRQARTAMTRLLATADDRPPLPRVDGRFIDAIHQSGLVGRGGAGFPTASKWRAVADRSRGNAVIMVNGAEGEPRSQKDRLLMTTRPHLILDGAFIAARVLKARRILLYIGERHESARQSMLRALGQRDEPERALVSFEAAPARYVAGAEMADIHFLIEGFAGRVGPRPQAWLWRDRRPAGIALPCLRDRGHHALPCIRELRAMRALLLRPAGPRRRLIAHRRAWFERRRPQTAPALGNRGAWARRMQAPRRRGDVPRLGADRVRERVRPPRGTRS